MMTFLELSSEDQEFEIRPAQIPMDTEAPVFRVPMNFVELTRGWMIMDPVDKTKKTIIARKLRF